MSEGKGVPPSDRQGPSSARCTSCGMVGEPSVRTCRACGGRMRTTCPHCLAPITQLVTGFCAVCGGSFISDEPPDA